MSKENLQFDEQSKRVFFFFFFVVFFLKEIENMLSVLLSSHRNTRRSLEELDKHVETFACSSCSHSISCSAKLPLMFP